MLCKPQGLAGGGLGFRHEDAIRLTIPQIENYLRPVDEKGGPKQTGALGAARRERERRDREEANESMMQALRKAGKLK